MPRSTPNGRAGAADPLAPLERTVVAQLFELQPGYAVFLGRHDYDGRLPDLSKAATDQWLGRTDRLLGELRALAEELPEGRRLDLHLLELLLDGAVFSLRDARDLDLNPMSYLGAGSLTSYLVRDYAPPADRVRAMTASLAGLPRLLDAGQARLEERLPEPFVKLGLSIGGGLSSHFDEVEAFARRRAPAEAGDLTEARARAETAVGRFLGRLKEEWAPRTTPEFALGAERFQRLLWVREGIRTPFREILAEGERDLARNQARLTELARRAPGGPGVEGFLETLYRDHPTADDLVPIAQRFVSEARSFVREHDLATIPEPESCRVEETPSYGRALSTASMNPPGPFEEHGDEGIYFVTPVDPEWTPERQEEWLRSLNRPMLRNVTVHEVYPGHYLQFLHHRRYAASLARRVYLSNAFTEGWAHYCEELAVEAGVGGRDPSAEAAMLHDALLRDCRLIASIGLHTGGWTVERATELFQREAHFERLPAEREAIRGTFDPEYYCYTLGKLAIRRARDRHLASRFAGSLRAFHDHLLGFGSPPVGEFDALFGGGAA